MFTFKNIQQFHKELLIGDTSCITAVEHFIQQIKHQPKLNAFIEVFEQEALQRAAILDEKRKNGEPLKKMHGVIIAIKDVICFKDHKVTAASKILQGFTSLFSATAVERLLDEDAIIIGNCNCDEFAMGSTNENSVYGKVLNGLNETKVPGGSSGGSAVAVQAGMCMLSLGTDTGGSVRQPADFCGIIGIKPTYGRISRHGLVAYASSFDQIGIFSNSIDDIALSLQIMSGHDDYDSTILTEPINCFPIPAEIQKKFRVAYFMEAFDHPSLDAEIKDSILAVLAKIKTEGHTTEPVYFDLLNYIVPAYYVLTTAEASSNLSRYDGIRYGFRTNKEVKDLTDFYKHTRSEGFGKEVKRRIMLGTFVLSAGYYDAYYSKAQQVRKLLIDRINTIFNEFDAIIMPTSPVTAFTIGDNSDDPVAMYLADIYTVFANLAGLPGISLPLFKHSNGMPFGLQIMTAKTDELTLLQLSQYILQQFKTY